jgi:hypothetical protein
MSALGQKQTWHPDLAMPALPPEADIRGLGWHVRCVPISDIRGGAEANAHAMLAYRSAGELLPLKDDVDRRGNWKSTMNLFAFAAAVMAVVHLVAGWQRPRLKVIVSGILWLLYAVWERLVATGVLCDSDCNIRVDLVFIIPILGLATLGAYQSYMGRPSQ